MLLYSVLRPETRSTTLVWLLISCIVLANCLEDVAGKVYVVKSRSAKPIKKCRVHVNTPLHVVMDRICLLCHEMFSHENPNLRAHCSSNCFKSEHFRKCLNVFAPMEAPKILNHVAMD